MDKNVGIIKANKATRNHRSSLEKLGYAVKQTEEGNLEVEVTEFLGHIDLSSGDGALREVIQDRRALTYKTRITFGDGQVLFGFPACRKLGPLSCLIMKPLKEEEDKPKSEFSLEDFLP